MSYNAQSGARRVIALIFAVTAVGYTVIPALHYTAVNTLVVCAALTALAAIGAQLLYRGFADALLKGAANQPVGPAQANRSRGPAQPGAVPPRTKGPHGRGNTRRGSSTGKKSQRRRNPR